MLTDKDKKKAVAALRRIEGQVRGVAEMVENERYCIDVLTQIAAAHEALRSVGKKVMENHLNTCVLEASCHSEEERSAKYREFIETMYKFVR